MELVSLNSFETIYILALTYQSLFQVHTNIYNQLARMHESRTNANLDKNCLISRNVKQIDN